jgi:hypothetical protein
MAAARQSAINRKRNAAEARDRTARHAHYAKGHTPGHPAICVCDECEQRRT